jgi:hypothetical protein
MIRPSILTPLVTLEEAMADWRQVVITTQPTANPDFVRATCDEIVNRARFLSTASKLNFPEVAAFLLTRSRAWVLGGSSVNSIMPRMPKTLGDLGMMKIAEGGQHGEPLSATDLKQALARPKHRTIQ